jgi:hypothetical protein
MIELAERFPTDGGLKERALNQAAREILSPVFGLGRDSAPAPFFRVRPVQRGGGYP